MNRWLMAIGALTCAHWVAAATAVQDTAELTVTSAAFTEGATLDSKFTCDGSDVSPPLQWKGAPPGAKSFAIIVDDPDAPAGTWVHWVLFNLPPATISLSENLPKTSALPNGAGQGFNSFDEVGYRGPCPPLGKAHRYFFKVYALDTMLSLGGHPRKKDLLKAMEGHILGFGQLMGKYQRRP